ncbi:MAG TPA: helix-turn-helix transcriptional regulator [Rhodoferax sp.]|jgi:putative transcriptional regulator|nr:helix-turn-helix transcriptional regulator [Rhodoferax sp.]HOF51484.1 helix-turn-helix transcriptional regulator [Rhodoferax sp.]HQY76668.1 helix-turn-helix transcriptional regulator [Rhodoferax sp.]
MRAATSGTNPCTNPWLLYQETATRVDLEAIEALCKYFNVQVGELFELTDA